MQVIFERGFVDCATDIPRIFRYGVGFHFYLGEMLVFEKLSGEEGHRLSKRLYEKKVDSYARSKRIQELTLAHALWVSRLDRVDPGGRAKVFLWIKLAWLGGCFYQRKSLVQLDGYHSSRANVLFLI